MPPPDFKHWWPPRQPRAANFVPQAREATCGDIRARNFLGSQQDLSEFDPIRRQSPKAVIPTSDIPECLAERTFAPVADAHSSELPGLASGPIDVAHLRTSPTRDELDGFHRSHGVHRLRPVG